MAETSAQPSLKPAVASIGLQWQPSEEPPLLKATAKIQQPKSELVALTYAVFPGYFIPAAFGHAYAEAHVTAAVISSARLSGRIMWMYSFFENFWINGAEGSVSGNDRLMFLVGLALDLGGYIFDIIHAPMEVSNYNRRIAAMNKENSVAPFIDMVNGGPCIGLALNF